MLIKLTRHIPRFFDTDVFPCGGSDFTVSKWAFGKVTLLEIDHMEIFVTCEVVFSALRNIKVKINAIQHKVYPRKQGHVRNFPEKEQINVKKGQNIWKFGQKCLKFENFLKKWRWLHAIIAHNKLLEKVLEQVARCWCFSNVYRGMEPGLLEPYKQEINWLAKQYIVREFDKWNVLSKSSAFWKSEIDWCTTQLSCNIGNGSKESDKHNKFHRHLVYEIRHIKGKKQSICNDTYLIGYLLKSIGQYE